MKNEAALEQSCLKLWEREDQAVSFSMFAWIIFLVLP